MKNIVNKAKNLGYSALIGVSTLLPYQAMAQDATVKDSGLSFYEHIDANANGKVDEGETSKLERVVFEEGENIAIDSKFKSGTGSLYVVSEQGKIMKKISQQYDTGVKTPQLLEGLPVGKYTTVFQQDGSSELNGSYMKIIPKGGSVENSLVKTENDKEGLSLLEKKNYMVACEGWNDFNGDNVPQRWEVANPRDARGTTFNSGRSAVFLSKSGMFSHTNAKVKKKKDKSFNDFEFKKKSTRGKTVMIETPVLTEGDYTLQIGQLGAKFKAN